MIAILSEDYSYVWKITYCRTKMLVIELQFLPSSGACRHDILFFSIVARMKPPMKLGKPTRNQSWEAFISAKLHHLFYSFSKLHKIPDSRTNPNCMNKATEELACIKISKRNSKLHSSGFKSFREQKLWDPSPEIIYWNGSWKALASTTSQRFQIPLAQGEARGEGNLLWN